MKLRQFGSFDVEAYRRRLRLLRLIYGETQQQFADRLGIPFKRWNHYERGYPVPRETVFILHDKIQGISGDWILFGMEGNLTQDMKASIRQAEKLAQEQDVQRKLAHKARRDRAKTLLAPARKKAKANNR